MLVVRTIKYWAFALACLLSGEALAQTPGGNTGPGPALPTYDTTVAGLSIAGATMNDLACLQGSATKVVRLVRLSFTLLASASSSMPIYLVRRSTASTGGTSVTMTPASQDTNNPAAVATATYWSNSAGQTPGTLASTLRSNGFVVGTAAGTGVSIGPAVFTFGTEADQPIVLRGTSDFICMNFNNIAVPTGLVASFSATWTEALQ